MRGEEALLILGGAMNAGRVGMGKEKLIEPQAEEAAILCLKRNSRNAMDGQLVWDPHQQRRGSLQL